MAAAPGSLGIGVALPPSRSVTRTWFSALVPPRASALGAVKKRWLGVATICPKSASDEDSGTGAGSAAVAEATGPSVLVSPATTAMAASTETRLSCMSYPWNWRKTFGGACAIGRTAAPPPRKMRRTVADA